MLFKKKLYQCTNEYCRATFEKPKEYPTAEGSMRVCPCCGCSILKRVKKRGV
jgi:hypothetical protein